jgi:alkylation response protein AidB-like acyl-CoA dehydrogenase
MTTAFDEVHEELRAVARDLLGKARAPAGRGSGGDGAPSPAAGPDWQVLADAGWLGLEVPEALDGAGATFAEVAVVLEEMGRAATSGPYLGTAVLGVGALDLLEPNPGRDALLRLVASGDRVVAVALPTADGGEGLVAGSRARTRDPATGIEAIAPGADADATPFRLETTPGGLRLHGRADFVPDAPDADRLLLVAHHPDAGPVVVVVHTGAEAPPNLDVTAQPVLDASRSLGRVVADGVEAREAVVWRFAGDPEASVERLLDRAALAVACDSLGLSRAMLDATVAYAGARHQFGRAIGSFQAVKHACADMLVEISVARELVAAAVQGVVADDPDAHVAASMAKSYVCAAAVDIVGKALQLHGGIGYTWDGGIHTYLKRAALNRSLFGSPRAHRHRLAQRYRQA